MPTSISLIGELEAAVQSGSQEKRIEMMRRVTSLFLGSAERFTSEQIELFGDVLVHLTRQVETRAIAELGSMLAPIDNAPNAIIQSLARHDHISVAGPVLTQSTRLSDRDLIEIAETKGQEHLGAISDRKHLAPPVTDVLVDRGDAEVAFKLARNPGASFSAAGFTRLAKRGENDERVAVQLGLRADMPPQLLRELVSRATNAVRKSLMAAIPPENQAAVEDALATVSIKIMEESVERRDFTKANALIAQMKSDNRLNEAALVDFANAGSYEELVAGLAQLCAAPVDLVERLMESPDVKAVLVACKAAGLSWPTFNAILKVKPSSHRMPASELEHIRTDFIKLSAATAQRMFRFWIIRGAAKQ